jgi:hypothetical protein
MRQKICVGCRVSASDYAYVPADSPAGDASNANHGSGQSEQARISVEKTHITSSRLGEHREGDKQRKC